MMSTKKPRVIAVVGQTATGKSQYAVSLAKEIRGEIISADSRQVYRGMNLGTGKITKREKKGIKHYCLDIVSPRTHYSVSQFVDKATKAIETIRRRKKIPIVCGGTGFWVDALLQGMSFPDVPPNHKMRKKLSKKSTQELFKILRCLDPKRARAIDAKNPVRLIRAIEIASALGNVPTLNLKSPYDVFWIGITIPTKDLRQNIHRRLLSRVQQGMIAEVQKLHSSGISWKRLESFGLEYRFVALFLQKKMNRQEMIAQLETAIVQFAKRQKTWFQRNKKIRWTTPKQALRFAKQCVSA